MKKDKRGFGIYSEFKDSYKSTITVKQSSAACIKACWIFVRDRDGKEAKEHMGQLHAAAAHLTPAQAKRLIKGLQKFVADAEGEVT